jgi:putative DNA primase/helicase
MSRQEDDNLIRLAEYWKKGGGIVSEHTATVAFTEEHRGQLLYDHERGKWYKWHNATYWRCEKTALAFHWAREIVARMIESEDDKTRRGAGKHSFMSWVEKIARADPAFAVESTIWDCDRYLAGTPGGTIDLHTGVLQPARPEDHITKQTAVAPAAKADCPNWLQFLHEATKGDSELIAFLQRFCGYTLTGDIKEHMLLFIFGPGGNGKGVFQRTVGGILADYCRIAGMATFEAAPWDRHTTELARLHGARLVMASETEEGRAWAEKRIKEMTGGDPITARFMRQDDFEYMPQFKLLLIGNNKPSLRNVDDAARRWFNIVPFIHKPPIADKDLEEKKLKPEWPGILRWMIDGCLEWQRDGLKPPPIVISTTEEYFAEQDLVKQWIEEKCETKESDTSANLYKSWFTWAEENGEKPGSKKWFGQALTRLQFKKFRDKTRRGFEGIKVKPEPATAYGTSGGDKWGSK